MSIRLITKSTTRAEAMGIRKAFYAEMLKDIVVTLCIKSESFQSIQIIYNNFFAPFAQRALKGY